MQQVHEVGLDDLLDANKRDLLRHAFTDPDRLRPAKTRQALTEEAAERFAALALRLRARGNDAQTVAHFVNRLVFCLFGEDVGLLPDRMFQRMMERAQPDPSRFASYAATLFAAIRTGGEVGFEPVAWFNGGLFDDDAALPLNKADLADLLAAARLDWSSIDPSILGTLFERGLDPDKRSQLGAHYTAKSKFSSVWPVGIFEVFSPVLMRRSSRPDRSASLRYHLTNCMLVCHDCEMESFRGRPRPGGPRRPSAPSDDAGAFWRAGAEVRRPRRDPD